MWSGRYKKYPGLSFVWCGDAEHLFIHFPVSLNTRQFIGEEASVHLTFMSLVTPIEGMQIQGHYANSRHMNVKESDVL